MNSGNLWILETITEKRLKFKRGQGHKEIAPQISERFVHRQMRFIKRILL